MRNHKTVFILLFSTCLACLISCSSRSFSKSNRMDNEQVFSALQRKMQGVWTDGNSENAIFKIEADSIRYVDAVDAFSYCMKVDTMEITFSGYTYQGQIRFIGDTLVMTSQDLTSKFWRFGQ